MHGGSSKDIGQNFKHSGRVDLFMAADMEVVKYFGLRNIEKAKGGDLVGGLLIIGKSIFDKLKREGDILEIPVDDMPGKTQYVFKRSSAETINANGKWKYLPSAFFRK